MLEPLGLTLKLPLAVTNDGHKESCIGLASQCNLLTVKDNETNKENLA